MGNGVAEELQGIQEESWQNRERFSGNVRDAVSLFPKTGTLSFRREGVDVIQLINAIFFIVFTRDFFIYFSFLSTCRLFAAVLTYDIEFYCKGDPLFKQ